MCKRCRRRRYLQIVASASNNWWQTVQDVDTLPLLQKQEHVRQAELLLSQMRAIASSDTAPCPVS